MELVLISFKKVMQSRAYTVIILGNEAKQFAIYTDPLVGRNLQTLLTNKPLTRPYTHHLIDSILDGFDIQLKQVVINQIEDTIYLSRLFLVQQKADGTELMIEIDARPSDSLTWAVMNDVPIYIKKDVFDSAVPVEV